VIEAAGRGIAGGVLAGVWRYQNAQIVRFDTPDGKEFRPIHHTKAGWKIGDPPGAWPLYRLNKIPTAGPVFVCEGEKACDAACAIGLAAVTSAHGSSSAEKTDWQPLAGRDVVILPDNDEPGRKYGRAVATILAKLEPPGRAKIIALPGLPEGGDIVEFLEAGGTVGEVVALADATPFIAPADLIGGPLVLCMAGVEAREVDWLWPGKIPLGRITLLVGRPGEGKSFATCDFAARISTGTPWPDGSPCPLGSVLFICCEDDPGDTIRPRLDAHHADCRNIHILRMVSRIGEDGKPRETMFSLLDLAALEEAIKSLADLCLIVIDPIGSYLGGSADSYKDDEVRSVLAPVAALAEKYSTAVLVVAHRRKGGGTNADANTMGSVGYTGIARATWHLSRDPDNKSRRLYLPGKNNLATEGEGLAFTIGGNPASIFWEKEPIKMSADDALVQENASGHDDKPGPEPEARKAAEEWLRGMLADGDVAAATIREEAKDAGFSYRTVQRAADTMKIIREKNQFNGGWQWRFPKATSQGDRPPVYKKPVHLSPSGNRAENGGFRVTGNEGDKLIEPDALGENPRETEMGTDGVYRVRGEGE
jgi:hypothetical protein